MKDLCSSEWAACSLQAHWISECHYLYLQGSLLGFVLCTRRQTPLSSSGAGNVTDPWQHRQDHCRKGQTRPVVHKFTLVLCCCPSALLKCDFWWFCVIFLCYVIEDGWVWTLQQLEMAGGGCIFKCLLLWENPDLEWSWWKLPLWAMISRSTKVAVQGCKPAAIYKHPSQMRLQCCSNVQVDPSIPPSASGVCSTRIWSQAENQNVAQAL